jgi:hypothetical protein
VNDTILLMTGTDLLDTVTPPVSQRSEVGQRILCGKEDIGKYGMWYGVVCKTVKSSCMSACCSLAEGRDSVPCLATRRVKKKKGRTFQSSSHRTPI